MQEVDGRVAPSVYHQCGVVAAVGLEGIEGVVSLSGGHGDKRVSEGFCLLQTVDPRFHFGMAGIEQLVMCFHVLLAWVGSQGEVEHEKARPNGYQHEQDDHRETTNFHYSFHDVFLFS